MFKTIRRFQSFLFRRRGLTVVFFIVAVLTSVIESVFPYFFKLFVDTIPTLDYQRLLMILIVFVSMRAVAVVLNMATFSLSDILMIDAQKNIRKTVFSYLQDLDFAFHTNKASGTIISIFKRGDGSLWELHHSLHHRIPSILIPFFVMLYFFRAIDIRIFGLAIISFVLAIIVAYRFVKLNMKKRALMNKEEDEFTRVVVDNMSNFETVKLFAKESWERVRLSKRIKTWAQSVWNFILTFRLLDIAMGTVINVSVFLILFISIKLAISGQTSIGDFVLVATFIGGFYSRLFDLVWGFRDIAKSYTDAEKYFGLLDNEIKVKDPAHPVAISKVNGEISFKKIHFSYKGRSKNAINGVTLNIHKGESIALVGRSGSGKTTLVKLLMRFYDLDSGQIFLDGVDIKKFKKSVLRSFIGVVPQEPVLFSNTIAYNIGYGKSGATFKEIKAAAKIANIDEFIESMPKKYQTQVGERGIKLSGGQKQRLAIARMILSNPDIVIFDEATSHLDSESEKLIQEAFWKARSGKTTVIIAHRLSTIMRADRIIVLEKGHIKEEGDHKSLIAKKNSLYSHFWNLQIKLD